MRRAPQSRRSSARHTAGDLPDLDRVVSGGEAAGPRKAPMVEPPLDRDVLEQELEELMR